MHHVKQIIIKKTKNRLIGTIIQNATFKGG